MPLRPPLANASNAEGVLAPNFSNDAGSGSSAAKSANLFFSIVTLSLVMVSTGISRFFKILFCKFSISSNLLFKAKLSFGATPLEILALIFVS